MSDDWIDQRPFEERKREAVELVSVLASRLSALGIVVFTQDAFSVGDYGWTTVFGSENIYRYEADFYHPPSLNEKTVENPTYSVLRIEGSDTALVVVDTADGVRRYWSEVRPVGAHYWSESIAEVFPVDSAVELVGELKQ